MNIHNLKVGDKIRVWDNYRTVKNIKFCGKHRTVNKNCWEVEFLENFPSMTVFENEVLNVKTNE